MSSSPPNAERYDALILGSGEAGKYLAWYLASSGKKTALIERRYIGGSCPNIACLPSKNFVHSAAVARFAAQATAYGLHPAEPGVNMRIVRERKRTMVNGLVEMHKDRFKQSGVELILGEGKFIGPRTLQLSPPTGESRLLTADTIIISTGSRATIGSIPGLSDAKPLTHVEALELEAVPNHLIVLGGGYVGLEFAQAFCRFGSHVTIIERSERLLPREDKDVSEALAQIFTAEGIDILTNTQLNEVRGHSGEEITLQLQQAGAAKTLLGSHLLVATGRTPNTDNLGLEKAGVALTPKGHIQVDEHLQTTVPGIYAVGDCAGSPHFTHIAFDDFRIVRETLAGRARSTTGRLVPSCLFVDPELARIGLNEAEAKRAGIPYRLVKLPMKAVLRTRTTGQTEGFFKALIARDTDQILGFTALGESAGEMMAPVQLAMSARLPYTVLRDSIFAHPTHAEGIVYLFSATPTLVS
jgi:pyruvate/2-oxoglutarate dehydrogenase complex dihydrolipoamide dehydrogenase (E3) component